MTSLRSGRTGILRMLLMAAGILLVAKLVFRGAGAPMEPARIVAPGARAVHLSAAGRYLVVAETVAVPRAMRPDTIGLPDLHIELADPDHTPVPVALPKARWSLVKILRRQHGRLLGTFVAAQPGDFHVNVHLSALPDGLPPDSTVLVAFSPVAAPVRFLWLLLGFGGQALFALRFIVQWLASEKAGRSVVPRSFWRYSLAGGFMILAYAIHTGDPVFILAYAFNALIYARNLSLIKRENAASAG